MADDEEKPNAFLSFLWNEEKGEFMGRDGVSWCKLSTYCKIKSKHLNS